MIPHIPKIGTFTNEEISIIENELLYQNYPSQPTEIQICQMAQLIQQKHFRDVTSLDIVVYLRQKLQNSQRLLKQFAEVKLQHFADVKVQQTQKNKEYVCKSKRKVRPSLPVEYKKLEETVQLMEGNTVQCHSQYQKRGRKTGAGQTAPILNQSCIWAYHELFYSFLDKNYLQEEELMVKLLRELQMIPERLTYYESRMIRRGLPSPRKFTPEFVAQQIDRLNQIRAQLRNSPRQRGKQPEVGVGKQVIALHPVCGHLHNGSIFAIYKQNQIMVKFNRPELGTLKVLDILIAAKEVSSPHKVIVDNMDFEIMGLAIRLLQLKADLLKLMKKYNNKAHEQQAGQTGLDNIFFQEYGWIGSTINILSLGIKHVISKFRIRGLNQTNQQRVGRHFSSILINPLALMEKQLEKSSEHSDIFASKQIKSIFSSHRETRTEQFTREFFNKQRGALAESNLQPERKEIMEKVLKAMIGVLVSLRYESRSFSVDENKYLSELMGIIDTSYPEHINQIYQTLHSITSKIGLENK